MKKRMKKKYDLKEIVKGESIFCATGITSGDLVNGVKLENEKFITETLVTPEDDSSLLDNATGSTNYAAKGAHRLKFSLTLAKLERGSTADSNFVELVRYDGEFIRRTTKNSQYNILEDSLARRTYDESGDYTVRPFHLIMKESNTLNESVGVYADGATSLTAGVLGATAVFISGDRITFKVDQIGSSEPGEGVRFTLLCKV